MDIITEFTLAMPDEKYKYFVIKIPRTAEILTIEMIEGNLCISVLLNNEQPAVDRVLLLVSAEHPFNKESDYHYKHIGKLKIPNSTAKHIFEILKK